MRSFFCFHLVVLSPLISSSLPRVQRSLASQKKTGFVEDENVLVSSTSASLENTPEHPTVPTTVEKRQQPSSDANEPPCLRDAEEQKPVERTIVAPLNNEKRYKAELAEYLVFAGGIANVVCYKRFGFYASMMTGNTIRFCSALAELRMADAGFYACTTLIAALGAALFQYLTLQHQLNKKEGRRHRNLHEILSLVAFCIFAGTDLVGRLFHRLPERWLGCFMAFGFGFVNAICLKETAVVTWAATGHVNKLGLALVDAFFLGRQSLEGSRTNLRIFGIFVLSVLGSAWICHKEDLMRPWLRQLPPMGTCFGLFYAVVLSLYGSKMKSLPQAVDKEIGMWEPLLWWIPYPSRSHGGYGVLSRGNNSKLSSSNNDAWL